MEYSSFPQPRPLPEAIRAKITRGEIVRIRKSLTPKRLGHLQERYDEGRVGLEDFERVNFWLSEPGLFPVYAPANQQWYWVLSRGGILLGKEYSPQTLLEKGMSTVGRNIIDWWAEENNPRTRLKGFMSSISLAVASLEGTPNPLDMPMESIGDHPSDLDLV